MASWPALASIGVGLVNLALLRYLWRSRDAPGARWFVAVIAIQAYWGLVYGLALSTFDPMLRLILEAATWLAPIWIGVGYVAFALAYTGRGHLIRTAWFGLIVAFSVGSSALFLTAPFHELVWRGFAIEPVFGAATVTYAHLPWVYVQFFATFALASLGTVVLLDTVVSYGPYYRAQSLAVALTPLPPAIAFTLWVFQVGPFWQLNLTPIMFLPHVALDLYALFRRDMFELNPAARRAGERTAVDDLGNPVVVVDETGRVVTLNDAAATVFGVGPRAAFAEPLSAVVDGDAIDIEADEQEIDVWVDGRRRTFAVTPSTLEDEAGNQVGHTVVFYDLTDEIRREQRLDVLNRVLRHNLRNDLGIVQSYAAAADDAATDAVVSDRLATVQEKTTRLLDLGEKARRVEQLLAQEPAAEPVALHDLLAAVIDEVEGAYPAATVDLECPPGLTVTTDPPSLRAACANLIENAAEHAGESPTVTVRAETRDGETTITVVDDGPGIPDLELDTLDAGEETPLQHGTGLGLWIVHWLTDRIGGRLVVDTDEHGTTASLVLPAS